MPLGFRVSTWAIILFVVVINELRQVLGPVGWPGYNPIRGKFRTLQSSLQKVFNQTQIASDSSQDIKYPSVDYQKLTGGDEVLIVSYYAANDRKISVKLLTFDKNNGEFVESIQPTPVSIQILDTSASNPSQKLMKMLEADYFLIVYQDINLPGASNTSAYGINICLFKLVSKTEIQQIKCNIADQSVEFGEIDPHFTVLGRYNETYSQSQNFVITWTGLGNAANSAKTIAMRSFSVNISNLGSEIAANDAKIILPQEKQITVNHNPMVADLGDELLVVGWWGQNTQDDSAIFISVFKNSASTGLANITQTKIVDSMGKDRNYLCYPNVANLTSIDTNKKILILWQKSHIIFYQIQQFNVSSGLFMVTLDITQTGSTEQKITPYAIRTFNLGFAISFAMPYSKKEVVVQYFDSSGKPLIPQIKTYLINDDNYDQIELVESPSMVQIQEEEYYIYFVWQSKAPGGYYSIFMATGKTVCKYFCLDTKCGNQSPDSCMECTGDQRKIEETCKCPNYYYDNEQNADCQKCPIICPGCAMKNSIVTCTTCKVEIKVQRLSDSCLCPNQYFDQKIENDQVCTKCDEKNQWCQFCTSTYQCTKCVISNSSGIDYFLLPESQYKTICATSCPINRYKDTSTNTYSCKLCSESLNQYLNQKCLECYSKDYCTLCMPEFLFFNGKCVQICPQGYYRNDSSTNKTCQECIQSLEVQNCTICEINILGQYTCQQCQAGYFLQDSQHCKLCNESAGLENCIKCQSNSLCTECEDGYFMYQNQCKNSFSCPMMYFADDNTKSCQLCKDYIPNCVVCDSQYICVKCKGSYYLYKNMTCVNNCPSMFINDYVLNKYSESIQVCILCSQLIQSCKQCASTTACSFCEPGTVLHNSICIDKSLCPSGTFVDNYQYPPKCSPCNYKCATCQDQDTKCINCTSDDRVPPLCICNSSTHYEGYDLKCKKCNFYEGACVEKCPENTVLNEQTQICQLNYCPHGYFLKIDSGNGDRSCGRCDFTCLTCSKAGATGCTICTKGLYRFQNICVQSCSQGTYPTNGTCQPCEKQENIHPNCINIKYNQLTVVFDQKNTSAFYIYFERPISTYLEKNISSTILFKLGNLYSPQQFEVSDLFVDQSGKFIGGTLHIKVAQYQQMVFSAQFVTSTDYVTFETGDPIDTSFASTAIVAIPSTQTQQSASLTAWYISPVCLLLSIICILFIFKPRLYPLYYEFLQVIPFLRFVNIEMPKHLLGAMQTLVPFDLTYIPNMVEDTQYEGYFWNQNRPYIRTAFQQKLFPSKHLDAVYKSRGGLTQFFIINSFGQLVFMSLLWIAVFVLRWAKHKYVSRKESQRTGAETYLLLFCQKFDFGAVFLFNELVITALVFNAVLQIYYYEIDQTLSYFKISSYSLIFSFYVFFYYAYFYWWQVGVKLSGAHKRQIESLKNPNKIPIFDEFETDFTFMTNQLRMPASHFNRYFHIYYGIKKAISVMLVILLLPYPRALCAFIFLIQLIFVIYVIKDRPMKETTRQIQILLNEFLLLFILLLQFTLSIYNTYLTYAETREEKELMQDRINMIAWVAYFAIMFSIFYTIVMIFVDLEVTLKIFSSCKRSSFRRQYVSRRMGHHPMAELQESQITPNSPSESQNLAQQAQKDILAKTQEAQATEEIEVSNENFLERTKLYEESLEILNQKIQNLISDTSSDHMFLIKSAEQFKIHTQQQKQLISLIDQKLLEFSEFKKQFLLTKDNLEKYYHIQSTTEQQIQGFIKDNSAIDIFWQLKSKYDKLTNYYKDIVKQQEKVLSKQKELTEKIATFKKIVKEKGFEKQAPGNAGQLADNQKSKNQSVINVIQSEKTQIAECYEDLLQQLAKLDKNALTIDKKMLESKNANKDMAEDQEQK